ncbi:hypothetical protein [Bradyrhizobium sp. AZCC 2289]|uniref:hypothetical protein n=1 Tax=Bradyrhizobium sp. AZCC 2289 TaxID=3117026 RepID=UPI002FEFE539
MSNYRIFQRFKTTTRAAFPAPYEWGPREWEVLWTDLLEQYERRNEDIVASHFTGAIVTAQRVPFQLASRNILSSMASSV